MPFTATIPTKRTVNLLIVLACSGLMAVALYMQYVMSLEPCYLCMTQRAFIIAIGLVALIAFVHNSTKNTIFGVLITLLSLGGSYFSGKQLWLQSLPEDQVPACGPSVDYLFDVFDFGEAISMLLQGDGNCAEIHWVFLGLSIPGWTMVAFIGFALLGIWQVFRKD